MKGNSVGRAVWETVQTVLIALLLALLIRQFVVESFVVQGHSMMPTLHSGERLLVNKFIYRLHGPRIGDIVVFLPPPAAHTTKDYIKRVIATGGDTVSMRDGQVYIDGKLQPEPYLPQSYRGVANFRAETVPKGDIFVLGDNRTNSEDSRYFGFVPLKNIRGMAMFAWWPLHDFGVIR